MVLSATRRDVMSITKLRRCEIIRFHGKLLATLFAKCILSFIIITL